MYTIANMEPSGLLGKLMQWISLIMSKHISAVSFNLLLIVEKNPSVVFSSMCGSAPCMHACVVLDIKVS